MQWMILPLKRYFDFKGRSRRKEFWMFVLFGIIAGVAATIVDASLGYGSVSSSVGDGSANFAFESNGPVVIIVWLALLIPSIACAVRRLHDTDRSGWWLLLIFIPIIGWIVLIVFYCLDGTSGTNRFGADPKGPDIEQVFS
jgi:uncharacterized membrane protein YhaH (DUF805 family)